LDIPLLLYPVNTDHKSEFTALSYSKQIKTMTTQTTEKKSKKPTHTVSIKDSASDQDNYLKIGVAWEKDNGSITIKLSGKQLIDDAIFLNPVRNKS
jgi:hypothetical protein